MFCVSVLGLTVYVMYIFLLFSILWGLLVIVWFVVWFLYFLVYMYTFVIVCSL